MSEQFSIPVFVYSSNLLDFLYNVKVITTGKKMINESRCVIPQFIPPFKVYNNGNAFKSIYHKNETPVTNPGGMNHYYTYYGEFLCTEEEFKEWELKQPKLKKD